MNMIQELQKIIEKYRKRCDESHAYYEREIYRDVIRDLRKLLFMEVDKERK